MTAILALDLATRLGWCFGDGSGDPQFGTYVLPKTGREIGPFIVAYHRWLRGMLIERKPDFIVFEAPMPDGRALTNMATSLKLKGLCTHTEFLATLAEIRVSQVPANEWKKSVVGRGGWGKSVKPYPAFAALAQRGFSVADDNAADALCIWIHAMGLLAPQVAQRFDPLGSGARRAGW